MSSYNSRHLRYSYIDINLFISENPLFHNGFSAVCYSLPFYEIRANPLRFRVQIGVQKSPKNHTSTYSRKRITMSLTDLSCRNAMPKAKQYRLYDTGGLYLEVKPSGKRVWRLKYAIHSKEKTLTMGDYPVLGLLKAREQRDIERENIRQGIDPSARKQEQKRLAKYMSAQSFEAVAIEWYHRNYDTWTHKHARNIIRRLELYVFPKFGKKPISEITPLDVLDCLQKIEDRNILHTAQRALQIIGQVLRYGVATMRAERDFTPDLRDM